MSITTILTPWYRRCRSESAGHGEEEPGSTSPTRILDHDSPRIAALVRESRHTAASDDEVAVLAAAHALIRGAVRPVYALEEGIPTSLTLRRGCGSCSQRLAILESVGRAVGVPTRVRALSIDRTFWYPRFPRVRFALPDRILLVWPEFLIDRWRPASELFGPLGCQGGGAFTNRGTETLFEAVGRCAVDWDGRTNDPTYDLSRFVRADHGYFRDRDDAFARLGQTLCAPSRALADPVLRRVAA